MFKEQTVSYTEHVVQRGPYHIYAREYPGEEPAIVLMHGFPDNLHLYDRLLPWLTPARRVVTFDFLGWGASDKPVGYPYCRLPESLAVSYRKFGHKYHNQ